MRFRSLLLIAALLSLYIIGTAVSAQSIARTLSRIGLTQTDINVMVRTASSLYVNGRAKAGEDVLWSNPDSGAFGMAEVLEVDGDCLRMAYRFQTQRRPVTQEIVLSHCKRGDSWRLAD